MTYVPFPDVEPPLLVYLREATGAPANVETPSDLQDLPRFLRVLRGPGSDDTITDAPSIDIEAFALTRGDAQDLAQAARAAMHNLQGRRIGAVLFDRVQTSTGPSWVDYRNDKVHRFVASYQVAYRAY